MNVILWVKLSFMRNALREPKGFHLHWLITDMINPILFWMQAVYWYAIFEAHQISKDARVFGHNKSNCYNQEIV